MGSSRAGLTPGAGPLVITCCRLLVLTLASLFSVITLSGRNISFAVLLGFFVGLLRDEMRWLDQLERKLATGPRPTGDAEELSEELDVSELVFN
jgi:hypothetical protein